MPIFSCRDWLINIEERRVVKNGIFLDLTPKSFDVIQLLIERHGTVVSKDDILGIVWNGSIVEEGNLPVHISKIRQALGQTKDEPIIETVPGVGYRFIGPLKRATERDWMRMTRFRDDIRHGPQNCVAVFPFILADSNLEHEYLAEGVYLELTNTLSRLNNLRVLARDTAMRLSQDGVAPEAISVNLGISFIVLGRLRVHENLISFNCEIIDCFSGAQIWGQNFKGTESDLVRIESELVAAVVTKITDLANGSGAPTKGSHSQDNNSFRLFLKARHYQDKATEPDFFRAIDLFNESIGHDPTNLASYVGLAEAYLSLFISDYIPYDEARKRVEPILETLEHLKNHDDAYHAMLGIKALCLDQNGEVAEKHLRRAISINPGCLVARHRLASVLINQNRKGEALREIREINALDPISIQSLIRTGRFFYKLGHYETAISYLSEALELSPENYIALTLKGCCLAELNQLDESLVYLRKSLQVNANIGTLSYLGYVHALKNDLSEARKAIDEIIRSTENAPRAALKIAQILIPLGEVEKAFGYLKTAIAAHDVDVIYLHFVPCWRELLNDPRYSGTLRRILPNV